MNCQFRAAIAGAIFICLSATACSQIITGSVSDAVSGDKLGFCTVLFKHYSFGTSANSKGEFSLRLSDVTLKDTIVLSYVGYSRKEIPVSQFAVGEILNVKLTQRVILLADVTVGEENRVIKIMERVIGSIAANYEQGTYSVQTEIHSIYGDSINFAILATSSFRAGYSTKSREDEFAITASCLRHGSERVATPASADDEALHSIIFGLFIRDFVAYRKINFLSKANLSHYRFDIESEDQDQVAVRFSATSTTQGIVPWEDLMSFSGRLLVNKANDAVIKINAHAVVDPEAMKSILDQSKVGEMDITAEYTAGSNGKYYCSKTLFKENFLRGSEVTLTNSLPRLGERLRESSYSLKNQNLCK